jgi:hypothetical protein
MLRIAHTSRPGTRAVPWSDRRPTAIHNEVALPAPFGPTTPKNKPRDYEIQVVDRDDLSEAL